MKKLVDGIVEFRKKIRPDYRESFKKLALGQKPDALYIGCSDSRVAVNLFASTDPGDLFVVRNVGNLVPRFDSDTKGHDSSVAAAVEFAVNNLGVKDIIICGHSECGAMQALCRGIHNLPDPHLATWLKNGDEALSDLKATNDFAKNHSEHNRLSQLNVLRQMENLKSFPSVRKAIETRKLGLHGWWFELDGANVYAYDAESHGFVLIDEATAQKIIQNLKRPNL